jgi:hypothetical protein
MNISAILVIFKNRKQNNKETATPQLICGGDLKKIVSSFFHQPTRVADGLRKFYEMDNEHGNRLQHSTNSTTYRMR